MVKYFDFLILDFLFEITDDNKCNIKKIIIDRLLTSSIEFEFFSKILGKIDIEGIRGYFYPNDNSVLNLYIKCLLPIHDLSSSKIHF